MSQCCRGGGGGRLPVGGGEGVLSWTTDHPACLTTPLIKMSALNACMRRGHHHLQWLCPCISSGGGGGTGKSTGGPPSHCTSPNTISLDHLLPVTVSCYFSVLLHMNTHSPLPEPNPITSAIMPLLSVSLFLVLTHTLYVLIFVC